MHIAHAMKMAWISSNAGGATNQAAMLEELQTNNFFIYKLS